MIDVEIEDPAWTQALPDAEALVRAAGEAALLLPSPSRGGVGGGGASAAFGGDPPTAGVRPAIRSSHPHTQPSPRKGERTFERHVTVLLTDDETVRDLNARFRRQDKPTNVLAFPAPANPERLLGDVALAHGVCAREAAEQGKSLADHLRHLVAHGVLHLLGYDHMSDDEAQVMEGRERSILAGLGIADPYEAR